MWGTVYAVLIAAAAIGVLSVESAKIYLTAEQVTVRVDWCGKGQPRAFAAGPSGLTAAPQARGRSRPSKSCYGSWTFRDGTTGKGQLRGVGDGLRIGSTRVMRATSTVAVPDSPWGNLLPPLLAPLALIGTVALVIRWWRRRGADSDDAPPAGAGPPVGNMPGPAPPAYPGPMPPAYPAPTGYPGPAPQGYPGPMQQAYPPPPPYPGPTPPPYPGPAPQGYPGPAPSGYPGPASQGYPRPAPQGGPSPWAPPDRYPPQG